MFSRQVWREIGISGKQRSVTTDGRKKAGVFTELGTYSSTRFVSPTKEKCKWKGARFQMSLG